MPFPRWSIRRSVRCLVATLSLAPGAALAQASALVDEGTFQVSRNGSPIGREAFSIVRSPAPGGQVFLAKGTSAIGDRTLTTALGTDSAGVPVTYESMLRERGAITEQTKGRGRPGRFSVLVQTRSGEAAREFVLSNGALLLDDDVFHQLYFVAIAGQHAEFVVVTPGNPQPERFRVEPRGTQAVEIAGLRITGRRFALQGPAGDVREVWLDAAGRLLKVSIPDRGLVALRDDPPRN
ncbi:MAG: hypothetical protein WD801_16705 [Gemmatimonadaceae bacterium]